MFGLDGGISIPNNCSSWYNIKKGEAWVHVDVLCEVSQLKRHIFELPAGYYPSPKRILKAIERKKHRTPLRKKFDSLSFFYVIPTVRVLYLCQSYFPRSV
jgi:hypothetical protein